MKKRVFFALGFSLLFCFSAISQDIKINRKKSGGFFIGVNAGVTHSTFRTDYQFKFAEHKYGPAAGIQLGYFFGKMFGIEAEGRFVQEGASYVPSKYLYPMGNNGTIRVLNSNVTLNMVDIPLLFKLNLDMGDFGLQVFAGPTYTMLLSARTKDEMVAFNQIQDNRISHKVTEQFTEYYFGGMAGIGLTFATFGQVSGVELRYKVGAQTVNDDDRVQLNNFPSETNPPETYYKDISLHTISLTYKFNFML